MRHVSLRLAHCCADGGMVGPTLDCNWTSISRYRHIPEEKRDVDPILVQWWATVGPPLCLIIISASTRHQANVAVPLAQRRRRWANTTATLTQRFVIDAAASAIIHGILITERPWWFVCGSRRRNRPENSRNVPVIWWVRGAVWTLLFTPTRASPAPEYQLL